MINNAKYFIKQRNFPVSYNKKINTTLENRFDLE